MLVVAFVIFAPFSPLWFLGHALQARNERRGYSNPPVWISKTYTVWISKTYTVWISKTYTVYKKV